MAQVIRMPIQRSDAAARSTAADAVGSPGWPTGWDIDDWGRDDTLAGFAARLGNVRWDATVGANVE